MLPNSYLHEIRLFIRNFTLWALFLVASTVFFFSFGIKEISIGGTSLFLSLPTHPSFAAKFFSFLTADLVPSGVTLVVTSPLAAFILQVKVALFLAFILTSPFLLYRLIRYLSPALYAHEKISALKVVIPSAFLFILGIIFSYVVIIPPTFTFLYSYTEAIGATPFFAASEFVGLIFALMIASGIMFLLPVVMTLLSRLDIVHRDFWKSQWRYAVLLFLIVSAIITPDGSGATMLLLSMPMAGLYGVGLIFSRTTSPARRSAKTRRA